MKTKELLEQSVEELVAKAHDLERELFELRTKLSVEKKLDKPHLIKQHKADRARILTVLNQKRDS